MKRSNKEFGSSDDKQDYGSSEGQEKYKERLKADRAKLLKEDEDNKSGRAILEALNSKPLKADTDEAEEEFKLT